MKTPQEIIDMIQNDSPCVYDILNEEHISLACALHDTDIELYLHPTPEQLLTILTEYSGDNHDVHYWSSRYAQMLDTPELYLCTRYHDTQNSSSATATIETKEYALAWFTSQLTQLPEFCEDWARYTQIEDTSFHFEDGDGSTLDVQIAPVSSLPAIYLM